MPEVPTDPGGGSGSCGDPADGAERSGGTKIPPHESKSETASAALRWTGSVCVAH